MRVEIVRTAAPNTRLNVTRIKSTLAASNIQGLGIHIAPGEKYAPRNVKLTKAKNIAQHSPSVRMNFAFMLVNLRLRALHCQISVGDRHYHSVIKLIESPNSIRLTQDSLTGSGLMRWSAGLIIP
jgi:hypothetical protein